MRGDQEKEKGEGREKLKLMILRDFYHNVEEDFLSRMDESGWNFDSAGNIANELNLDIQRALSVYLQKFFNLIEVFVTSKRFQTIWENTFSKNTDTFISKILKDVKPVSKVGFFSEEAFYIILAKQIAYYKPDIILVLPFAEVNHYFFSKLKKIFNFKLVGYSNATPFGYVKHISLYDFVFSPFMPHVFKLKSFGVKAEYLPLGFEPYVLEKLKGIDSNNESQRKIYDVVFAGSLHQAHRGRVPFLKKIADAFGDSFHIWTQSYSSLTPDLRRNFRGVAFNIDYYYILSRSKIVLNHHGSILPWAHNLRLFETTGVGSFLLTDNLPGVDELFEVGKEVETYRDPDECIDKIRYYLSNGDERETIAKLGQMGTLREHTYEKRIEKLFDLFLKYGILD